jgi:hypothetical protein
VVGLFQILKAVQLHQVRGDIVECGVGMGGSFLVIGTFAHRLGLDARLIGFDSFRGFPQPSPQDDSLRKPQKGDWSGATPSHVESHFASAGLDDYRARHVTLVEGYFDTTLPRATDIETISFLNLDVDLYESYVTSLKILGPRVTGLILYDEYASPKWPGATRAINEVLPALDHILFHSRLMNRYFSTPVVAARSDFMRTLTSLLDAVAATDVQAHSPESQIPT